VGLLVPFLAPARAIASTFRHANHC